MLLNDLLNLGQVLGGNLITSINDLFTCQFEDNRLLGRFTHLTLKQLLKFLTFFNNRVKFFSDYFIIALFKTGTLLIEISQSVVAFCFNFSDLRVDIGRLFTLGDGNFILDTFECFVAGVFIHVRNDVLCEVKHTVKVAARDIQQHAQIRWDAARIPDMCNGCRKVDVSHAFTAHCSAGDFHAAFITDDAFITGVLVFTTITLPITLRSENGFTKQAILFRS